MSISVLEIIAGVLLIITCIILILVVLAQESKGQGLSSVLTGTEMVSNETRGRGKERRQTRMTTVLGVAFGVLAVLVNVFSAIAG